MVVLNNGKFNNVQIVSEQWINKISEIQFDISNTNPFADYYGFLWYRSIRNINNQKVDYVFASGNGGNVLIIVPELDFVVALTSSAYGQGYGHFRANNIFKYLLSSIKLTKKILKMNPK